MTLKRHFKQFKKQCQSIRMLMISLTPNAIDYPIEIESAKYEQLVRQKSQGWSVCHSQKEWLAKLHYLRQGKKEGKIKEAAFQERERALVLSWWRKLR